MSLLCDVRSTGKGENKGLIILKRLCNAVNIFALPHSLEGQKGDNCGPI